MSLTARQQLHPTGTRVLTGPSPSQAGARHHRPCVFAHPQSSKPTQQLARHSYAIQNASGFVFILHLITVSWRVVCTRRKQFRSPAHCKQALTAHSHVQGSYTDIAIVSGERGSQQASRMLGWALLLLRCAFSERTSEQTQSCSTLNKTKR